MSLGGFLLRKLITWTNKEAINTFRDSKTLKSSFLNSVSTVNSPIYSTSVFGSMTTRPIAKHVPFDKFVPFFINLRQCIDNSPQLKNDYKVLNIIHKDYCKFITKTIFQIEILGKIIAIATGVRCYIFTSPGTETCKKYSVTVIFLLYISYTTTFFQNIIPKSILVRFWWNFYQQRQY